MFHRSYGYTHQTSPFFFFFNDTATPGIYTLSLHDALPISRGRSRVPAGRPAARGGHENVRHLAAPSQALAGSRSWPVPASPDRKSTRLNSSHSSISYAVFCLKKKNTIRQTLCSYIVIRGRT